ncbi:aminotransferase class I/II-fold pyridoxal phosphate-dependent enzyme [Oceanobacter mangrovi]|uniref:aminotransferase class I/II-fold pyridoxal phosphate-dependent enzyme n=1 Tax=Oceanobacter mangrovi TaxID=2862510 RepID=UPI001C8E145E|nr:aminotransferase class I/II-fold pyridoxal phosphate-dependent enzyme [Oceanobacter mangrovi]
MSFFSHGGDVATAAQLTGIPLEQWLDLSRATNPEPYPFAMPELSSFTAVSRPQAEVLAVAREYYGQADVRLITGTNSLYRQLPLYLPDGPLLVPSQGYGSGARFWQQGGREVRYYPSLEPGAMVRFIEDTLADNPCQHLLVLNPNDVTGVQMTASVLRDWAGRLADGYQLIVDEVMLEHAPETSILEAGLLPDNLVVLRSLSAFFGLPGLRVAVALFGQQSGRILANAIDEYAVNIPAQRIACEAWADSHWQVTTRTHLWQLISKLHRCLSPLMQDGRLLSRNGLFISYLLPLERAEQVYQALAAQGIMLMPTPIDNSQAILRAGLLAATDAANWERLQKAVDQVIAIA